MVENGWTMVENGLKNGRKMADFWSIGKKISMDTTLCLVRIGWTDLKSGQNWATTDR